MLKSLINEKNVVSVSFRQKIRSISDSKMLKIDLEIAEKIEVFVVFHAISVQFPRVFVNSSITLNNQRTSCAIHNSFLKRTLQRFASKTPTFFLLSTSSFLSSLCLRFEAFWVQNDGKRSTKIERLIHSALREIIAGFEKLLKLTAKSRKSQSFLDFRGSVNFVEIGKM